MKSKATTFLVIVLIALFRHHAGAFPIITNLVETGGDNEPTDTVVAQWTGRTFTNGVADEPVPGRVAGEPYTAGLFGNHAPAFVDRNHRYTNASATVPIPSYLIGREYIMSGNDNRDNTGYRLGVSVAQVVRVYLLIDNRLSDGNGTNPPAFDPTHMQWVLDEGWTPVLTGANRSGSTSVPDEVGIDEGADGTLNQWFSVYTRRFLAGTFQLRQADNADQNMYGVVVVAELYGTGFEPPTFEPGRFLGQDGWYAFEGLSPNAVTVSTNLAQSGAQSVRIDGARIEEFPAFGVYVAPYLRNLNYDPIARGTPIIELSGAMALAGNDSCGAGIGLLGHAINPLGLDPLPPYFPAFANIGIDLSTGVSQLINEDVVFVSGPAFQPGQWGNFRVVYDFQTRTARGFFNGALIGEIPFTRGMSNVVHSIQIAVVSTGPTPTVIAQFDNLSVRAFGSIRPALSIGLTATNTAVISWPAQFINFDLQQNSALNQSNWADVSNPPVMVGNERQVVVRLQGGSQFFRLRGR